MTGALELHAQDEGEVGSVVDDQDAGHPHMMWPPVANGQPDIRLGDCYAADKRRSSGAAAARVARSSRVSSSARHARQPAVAAARGRPAGGAGLRGQLDEEAAPVVRVGAAHDAAALLELADGLGHRLRPHLRAGGEVADALRTVAVERPEHRALAHREAVLGAHAPDDLAERDAQLGGQLTDVSHLVAQADCTVYLVKYKWIALSNATLAVLLATLDASITLIAMPDIFRGIHLDPLRPENSFYLLWMILGYLVVTSVLIVSLGRLGDMYGRVKIYNLGFVIYTVASLFLAIDWFTGAAGATYLIVWRIVQGVGGACLLANAAAIITDAFPPNQRGMALGINNIVGVSGMFVGLVLGGILAPIDWRLVFLISVPVGLFGTVWAYMKLRGALATPRRASVDWWGNVTFALGLILVMVSVTYGIRPYGDSALGWGSPRVIALLAAAAVCLIAFVDRRAARRGPDVPAAAVPDPRVHVRHALDVPVGGRARRPDVHADHLAAGHLAAPARLHVHRDAAVGGHLHAAADARDALAGPASGYLSDRFGARWFAFAGMVGSAAQLRRADGAADRLHLPGVRRDPGAARALDGHVRLAQPRGDHEQPAEGAPRRRRGDEPDLPELRPGALDRHLLHAADRRARRDAAAHDERGAGGARRRRRDRPARRRPAAGLDPVRRVPGLQPDPEPARPGRAARALAGQPGRA